MFPALHDRVTECTSPAAVTAEMNAVSFVPAQQGVQTLPIAASDHLPGWATERDFACQMIIKRGQLQV